MLGREQVRASVGAYKRGSGAGGRRRLPAALALQRMAGNRAVTSLLGGPIVVQRHESDEHRMLGDRTPEELVAAASTYKDRVHLLFEERRRALFFKFDALADPREAYPKIQWHKLRASGLWVSYGELNALPDYLPDPDSINNLPAETMIPIVQKMREIVVKHTSQLLPRGKSLSVMSGQASAEWYGVLPKKAADVMALQNVTKEHGVNVAHKGLLARNACHFAPHNWHRWEQYHNDGVASALRSHAAKKEGKPDADRLAHEAWIANGYADHFLQDSFAAGHFVNKILIMQWFLEYANANSFVNVGLPSAAVRKGMTTEAQPDLGGGDEAYTREISSKRTTPDDRSHGDSIVDPQTAHERSDLEGRVAGSGVRGAGKAEKQRNYQLYLELLNNAFIQLGPLEVHNYFNEHGLAVANDNGDQFLVGGDATLLTGSGPIGLELAARAAQHSRQAIAKTLELGDTPPGLMTEEIAKLIPRKVMRLKPDGSAEGTMDIPTWHAEIRPLCEKEIFPEILRIWTKNNVVRAFSSEMMPGGISQDSPAK